MNENMISPATDEAEESSSCCSNTSCCPPSSPVIRSTPKIGRNDPCFCGSELKFKKCCGKN